MKPCFGYIRVSTVRQGDGASLEAQKDAIMGFASQHDLTIIKWFEEKETASKTGRPIFDAMLSSLGQGEADGVVIHKIDRSARNYADWARLDEVARLGIKIYFAADSLDFDSRGGRLLADIQMALAADYSRNLSLEVKKGIYGRLKQGIYPFRAPIGYLDTGGGNLKAVCPEKGPLVRKVFELYCSGEYSITSLTEEMRRRGLKGHQDSLVVRRSIDTILNNPFYCGQMLICGKLYQGAHEALVSTAQFRKVKAIKANRVVKKSTKQMFLYRGLLKCGACNGTLSGERQKAHVYYRCHTRGCGRGKIREDRLSMQVTSALSRLELSEEDASVVSEKMSAFLSQRGSDELARSIRLRIANATGRQERLTDLLVEGAIDKQDYELRKQNTRFELQQLREELQQINNGTVMEERMQDALTIMTSIASLFESCPLDQKRQLLRNSLYGLRVLDGKLTVQPSGWLETTKQLACKRSHASEAQFFQAVAANEVFEGILA